MRTLLVVALLAVAVPAHAEDIGSMKFDLLVPRGEDDFAIPSNTELKEIFSLANCQCDTEVRVRMSLSGGAAAQSSDDNVQLWLGLDCAKFETERLGRCEMIGERPVQDFAGRFVEIPVSIRHLIQPNIAADAMCPAIKKSSTIWGLVDEGNDGTTYDHPFVEDPAYAIDTEAPPLVTNLELRGSEDGVVLSWDLPSSRADDIFGYQLLCARGDGSPLYATPSDDPEYATAKTLCNMGEDTLVALSPRWICSSKISGTSTTARVDLGDANLMPGEQISVTLVEFDEAGNAVGIAAPGTAGFEPVRDGWEHYDEVGSAEPGFCAIGVGTDVGGGAMWLLLGVAVLVWRQKKLLGLLVLLVPVAAEAQLYLEEAEREREPGPPVAPQSDWAFEIKLGPYYPAIDDEAGLGERKPYEEMFGTRNSILPQIEVDRFFLHPGGALGVGLTLGYTYRTAKSFVEGSMTERGEDGTAFHVIPTALSAVYRFTALADNTVVPIVPYAKLGLAYYLWWFTKGGGDLSERPDGKDAIGGTLGWQGSIGLSVRADAIDPDGIKDLGVDHIGFFFELTYADVSGFGADDKLHVGDFNWAAGVNFEF
jgi:hypothetical protein